MVNVADAFLKPLVTVIPRSMLHVECTRRAALEGRCPGAWLDCWPQSVPPCLRLLRPLMGILSR